MTRGYMVQNDRLKLLEKKLEIKRNARKTVEEWERREGYTENKSRRQEQENLAWLVGPPHQEDQE